MKMQMLIAVVALILAIVIFVFAEGARRYYSGGFFALVSIVNLLMAMKKRS